jgi:hypothetical protein
MMAEDPTARPVSGEIMTGPAANAVPERFMQESPGDIVDADYEVLPRLAAKADPEPSPFARPFASPPIEGMDMLRKPETAGERPPASRGGPIFWIAGVGAALAAFWVSGGHALVRHASLPFDTGQSGATLSISGIASRVDATGPEPVLFVDGETTNDGARPASMPPLEISVTGNDGHVTRYRLGTSGRPLAPGQRFGFSSRLDVPRNGVRTVSVTFAE